MRRRTCLALLAASLATGCVADGGPGSGPKTDRTASPAVSRSETRTDASDRGTGPFETVTIGRREDVTDADDDRPHVVSVTNEGDVRDVEIRIDRAPADSDVVKPVLEGTYEFPAGGTFEATLLEPARYAVHLSVPTSGQEHSFTVERSWFDCNYSAHDVTVPASAPIDVTISSTLVACSYSTDESTARRGPTGTPADDPAIEPATEDP